MAKRARAEDGVEPTAVGLGDIMGSTKHLGSALRDFSPLHRIVISANGNLQRLLSSYHNSAVSVITRYNRSVARGELKREVELRIFDIIFAIATSTVCVTTDALIDAIEKDGLGIGQLFRHQNIMPEFELENAGHLSPGPLSEDEDETPPTDRIWREYVLSGEGIRCEIREVIRADLFELNAPGSTMRKGSFASFGDIMAPDTTFMPLPSGFTPQQRLLLTANGNVQRILSSFYCKPLQLYVAVNHKRDSSVYDRQAAMLLDGRQLMLAKSVIFVTDERWAALIESKAVDVGGLFRHFSELPTFTLHSAGRGPDFLWRQYQLKASGMTCEINETFSLDVFDGLPSEHGAPGPASVVDNFGF